MPVYATYRDPTFGAVVQTHRLPTLELPMSRRQLTLAIVAIVSLVASACGTSPTAPRHGDDTTAIVTAGSTG